MTDDNRFSEDSAPAAPVPAPRVVAAAEKLAGSLSDHCDRPISKDWPAAGFEVKPQ